MLFFSRSATVVALAVVVLAFPYLPFTAFAQESEARNSTSQPVRDAPPPSCHVTLPSQGTFASPPVRATGASFLAHARTQVG
jgi:hypothetical protein